MSKTGQERPRQDEDIPAPPLLLLAGAEDDDGTEPHICRGID